MASSAEPFSHAPPVSRYENGNVLVRDPKDRAELESAHVVYGAVGETGR